MKWAPLFLFGLLAAGCETIDPGTAQLDDFQDAKAKGEWSRIVAAEVKPACGEACARLHAIRGEACLTLGMKDVAPAAVCPAATDERRQLLACAADEYQKALAAPPAGTADLSRTARLALHQGRTHALYCSAELTTVTRGVPLAEEAAREAANLQSPEKDLFTGWASLFLTNEGAGTGAQRCAQARRAEASARAGLAAQADASMRTRLERIARDAARSRASLTGCGG